MQGFNLSTISSSFKLVMYKTVHAAALKFHEVQDRKLRKSIAHAEISSKDSYRKNVQILMMINMLSNRAKKIHLNII